VQKRGVNIVANEFVAKTRDEGRTAATASETEWLVRLASKSFRPRLIAEITAPQDLKVASHIPVRFCSDSRRGGATILT
jgi:hypothetical protein